MRVLALTTYPVESAATRFRVHQLLPGLARRGIDVDLAPFLDEATYRALYDRRRVLPVAAGLTKGLIRRVGDVRRVRRYDVVLVQREVMLAGPPVFEALMTRRSRTPMVLDLDDATWVGYDSPTYGALARLMKWPAKALSLIDCATVVTCGASAILRFVEQRGATARLLPPAADTSQFRPKKTRPGRPRRRLDRHALHVAVPRTAAADPAIAPRHRSVPPPHHRRRRPRIEAGSLPVDNRTWSLADEAEDFASLDVGLYPLPDNAWARASRVSSRCSTWPLACRSWRPRWGARQRSASRAPRTCKPRHPSSGAISSYRLLIDADLRSEMAHAGRAHAVEHHTVEQAASSMCDALFEARG